MSRTPIKSASTYQFSKLITIFVVYHSLTSSVNAFSPILTNNAQHCPIMNSKGNLSCRDFKKYRSQPIAQTGSDDENNTPFSPDNAEKPLDPLIQALTKMDDETLNAPTIKAPLFGEIPIDGSIVVLIPAVLIAVAGFIFSIVIGIQSKDIIADQITQVTEVLSTPPAKEQKNINGCRGLCSDQTAQLDSMRGFMQKLAKESPVTESPAIVPITTGVDEPSTVTQGEAPDTSPIYGTDNSE